MANFDEFDALLREPAIDVLFVPPGRPLPQDAALIILAGTKATIAELEFFRSQGWDIDLYAHVRRGGRVLGICGGYQMLGRLVSDPHGIEGRPAAAPGLALLEVETVMTGAKTLREVTGVILEDLAGGVAMPGCGVHGVRDARGNHERQGFAAAVSAAGGGPPRWRGLGRLQDRGLLCPRTVCLQRGALDAAGRARSGIGRRGAWRHGGCSSR